MDSQSILYRTLFLFAGAFTAAVLTLVLLIWWTMRRGSGRRLPDACSTSKANPSYESNGS